MVSGKTYINENKKRGRPRGSKNHDHVDNRTRDPSGGKEKVVEEGLEHDERKLNHISVLYKNSQQGAVIEVPASIDLNDLLTASKKDKKPLELIDSLEFLRGTDKLTIRFSKKANRMYRIQIFLNNGSEIRPVTYTGARTAYTFWDMLKGCLKTQTKEC